MQYWVKVVFTDNQEVMIRNAVRHTISDDMEVLEIDTPQEVMIIPSSSSSTSPVTQRYLRKNKLLENIFLKVYFTLGFSSYRGDCPG